MPRHELAHRIIEGVGEPLAAPSANMFGRTSPTSAKHVEKEFNGQVLVLDGGHCEVGIESTVIDLTSEGLVKILRPGTVTAEMFEEAAKRVGVYLKVGIAKQKNSPGTLKNHYQPSIPLVLVDANLQLSPAEIVTRATKFLNLEQSRFVELTLDINPQLAARTLYAGLRELEQSGASGIYFSFNETNQQGEWEAIWDRLWRAASAEIVS